MAMPVENQQTAQRIANRYDVVDVLGRGAAAVVYRVRDSVTGAVQALKQLLVTRGSRRFRESTTLFQREFHTLAQLAHPSIIQVFDWGVADARPYYTMEILDGGDLRQRAPLPWRAACRSLYEVCSSLALLHSRSLVHHDVSPLNIGYTRAGTAKLMDFGAVTPIGALGAVLGTPPFIAPEALSGAMIDPRADLFSLGATLYFALTGQLPYQAVKTSQLARAWSRAPDPPSSFVDEIPEALDALVLGLVQIEPQVRPRSAFEVMQQLAVVAGIEHAEAVSVPRAYLSTPILQGRDETLRALRKEMERAFKGKGRAVIVEGPSGVGRSRLLHACALEAKTLGAVVLHARASAGNHRPFSLATRLSEQFARSSPETAFSRAKSLGFQKLLFEKSRAGRRARAIPELRDFTQHAGASAELQNALVRWLVAASEAQPLAIIVDDLQRIDEQSATLLAALASQAEAAHLFVAVSLTTDAPRSAAAACQLIESCARGYRLDALSREDTVLLFKSVFGDVPNVASLSDQIHRIANGSPRLSVDLAQHLLDKSLVFYEAGGWTLPSALSGALLPASAEDAMRERIGQLTPLARWLAESQCLAGHDAFTRDDYGLLCGDERPYRVDAAVGELLSQQILSSDGRLYTISHDGWVAVIEQGLDPAARKEHFRRLADFYQSKPGVRAIRHLLSAGCCQQALDELFQLLGATTHAPDLYANAAIDPAELALLLERALETAHRLGRRRREIFDLHQWLCLLSLGSQDAVFERAAPAWLAQLERDSGLADWKELCHEPDSGARLMQALARASERYSSTPEAERVYSAQEAIERLVHYVSIALAIGVRSDDARRVRSLSTLLEPFAPLSPIVFAIWQNAIASCEASTQCQLERARRRWRDVYERLGDVTGAELKYVKVVRSSIALGLGILEAWLGLPSATYWAGVLERDPMQRVNALYVRRSILLQRGDTEGAERLRREAEVCALESRVRPMFPDLSYAELHAYAIAGDLTGLKQVVDRAEAIVARNPNWVGFLRLARAEFLKVRGNLEAARAAFEECIATTRPDASDPDRQITPWLGAVKGCIEVLLTMGDAAT
ncbi:MAG TPA: serine/threonine-protein kinase, partial [Polyangiaceae bacterium]|nr:serine/threonine-protein kinase [Polyangiaceae bacterium]